MTKRKMAIFVAFVLLLVGVTDLSAQGFFPVKTPGTYQVRFSSNALGVQVAIDNQPAGTIPLTVWVVPGVHQFSFTAPGQATKTIPYPVNGDVEVPFISTQRTFPLSVNTNVPGATFALDGQPFVGNTLSVTSGNHTLTVSAPGYQTLTLPFQQPTNANTINITLVALKATLTVNTDKLFRPGTPYTLFVDNVETPGPVLSLAPGPHSLKIVAGALSIETNLSLAGGQNLTISPTVQWEVR